MKEVLDEILAAERQAEEIIAAANERAAVTSQSLSAELEKIKEEILAAGAEDTAKVLVSAEKEAEKNYNDTIQKYKSDAMAIKAAAEKNIASAINLVSAALSNLSKN